MRKLRLKFFFLLIFLIVRSVKVLGNVNPCYDFALGNELIYRFRYRCESSYDFETIFEVRKNNSLVMPGAKGNLRTLVSGELSLIPFNISANAVISYCRFRIYYLSLEFGGTRALEDEMAIKSQMEKPFYLSIDKLGRVVHLEIGDDVSSLANGYVRTLVSLFQVVFPKQFGENNWQTEEENPEGIYKASYKEVKEGKHSLSFTKRKICYQSDKKTEKEWGLRPKIVPKGEIWIEYALEPRELLSLKGKEEEEIFIGKKKVGNIRSDIISALILKDKKSEREISALQGLYGERKPFLRSLRLYQEESNGSEIVYRKILGGANFDNLLQELNRLDKGELKDSLPLYLKIKAFIYLHPDACEEIDKVLQNNGEFGPSQKLLLEALGAIGSPQAQGVIISFIRRNKGNPDIILPCLYMLVDIKKPIPEVVDELWVLAFNGVDESLSSTSQLLLGVIANKLQDSSPEISEKIVDKFIDRLNSASSPEEIIHLLLCLGNAGMSSSFPVLQKFASDESSEIRATALWAMRFIKTKEAEEALLKSLLSDPEPSVRLRSALSLSFRKMSSSSYQIQKRVFLESKDEQLRIQILKNLWNEREAFPEIVGLIKKAAKEDRQEKVKETAESIQAGEKNL